MIVTEADEAQEWGLHIRACAALEVAPLTPDVAAELRIRRRAIADIITRRRQADALPNIDRLIVNCRPPKETS